MAGERKGAGVLRYLREAFTFKWNLLLFGGAVAAGVLSGRPDVALPLVAAAELAYLAGLTSLPRFQSAIDARARTEERPLIGGAPPDAETSARKIGDLLAGLEPAAKLRFLRLRARCVDMQRIASQARGQIAGADVRDLRAPALDRLLWTFLRLLCAQRALDRFLATTAEADLQRQIDELTAREKAASERGDERIVRSVRDSIATAQLRLENYRKSKNNAEFVGVELDRIEGKIQALTEMAVSHQDPDDIASQVDAVADGMAQTEQSIRELQAIAGIGEELGEAPQILNSDLREVVRE